MKKIININLSGRVIPIEDSAYESLQQYIESLRRYFSQEDGRDEIINDIESRVAELMNEKVRKGSAAISDADINEIIGSMGRVEDFEEVDAAEDNSKTYQNKSSSSFTYKQPVTKGRLYRDTRDKMIGGVCSGIANYMNVDPAVVRLLFAIASFGAFGFGVLLYVLLWIILPARNLDSYVGKRLFRNPEDKVISGVAGGLGAYFNKPSWAVRLVFAAPLLLNILFGVLGSMFFFSDRDIFPNLFIGSFTGTFCLAYIILWIVLPEANSPFEKMEMRGEKVDVNSIRQNVQEGMTGFKNRMETWSEEVKTTAQQFSSRANQFVQNEGKAFAGDVKEAGKPLAQGLGHVIGVLFKAFFIFVAGCIALALFGALMVIIFGGVAWWPINNFLWTSALQKALAWGTLLFFIGVPIVGIMTWLVRRVVRVRSRNKYLGWIFGGLWVIGWICAVCFAASIAKDIRVYDRTEAIVVPVPTDISKLIVDVNEPEIRYGGNLWLVQDDNTGWDITDDMMKYNNVKLRVQKSEDSFYHVRYYKYSAGQNLRDVQDRAAQTKFNINVIDSALHMGSGLVINKGIKFRGQGVIVEIQVPVGKQIRFDESVLHAYNPWMVRRSEANYRNWNVRARVDWDHDDYFAWNPNTDYVMTTDGNLVSAEKAIIDAKGIYEKKSNADSLRLQIEEREKQLQNDREKLDEIERTESSTLSAPLEQKTKFTLIHSPFVPLII
jgi:phage shock protein PspC (stress-responsive transcriptional regulator)